MRGEILGIGLKLSCLRKNSSVCSLKVIAGSFEAFNVCLSSAGERVLWFSPLGFLGFWGFGGVGLRFSLPLVLWTRYLRDA